MNDLSRERTPRQRPRYEQRILRRLTEIDEELHDATVLRDHCAEWVDNHQRTIHRLEDERDRLRKEIAF